MSKGRWEIHTAKTMIERNRGGVYLHSKKITHESPGIKVLGAIDYLVNHHGFKLVRRRQG